MENAVIVVRRTGLGVTLPEDENFGSQMLDSFLHVLESRRQKPRAIVFYTEGVKNVAEDSSHVLALKVLQEAGVRLLACKTCLEYYGLLDKVAVGEVVGMPDIVGAMEAAGKVIAV
jgi:intracellular sulfur oxidation DsrE/DsrF family protein